MQVNECCKQAIKDYTVDYQDWAGGYICPKCGKTIPLMEYYKLKQLLDSQQRKR